MAHQVFISYSRDDSQFVRRLVDDLTQNGVAVWLDVRDIQAGERWDTEVQNALRDSDYFMVVLSPTSAGSDNVQDEIAYALSKKRHVYPILYQDCDVPYRLARVQYVDFRTDYDGGLKRLLEQMRITGLLEDEAGAAQAGAARAAAAILPEVERAAAQPREKPPAPTPGAAEGWKGRLAALPTWAWGAGAVVVVGLALLLIFGGDGGGGSKPTIPASATSPWIYGAATEPPVVSDTPEDTLAPPGDSPTPIRKETAEPTALEITQTPDPYHSMGDCVTYDPPCTYTVVSLDSFSKIASKMYGAESLTPLLMNANRDPKGYRIQLKPAQNIFVPHPETTIAELVKKRYPRCGPNVFPCWYEVRSEQSYDDLARIFYANPSASKPIQTANWEWDESKPVKLVVPEITPGVLLVLPVVESGG